MFERSIVLSHANKPEGPSRAPSKTQASAVAAPSAAAPAEVERVTLGAAGAGALSRALARDVAARSAVADPARPSDGAPAARLLQRTVTIKPPEDAAVVLEKIKARKERILPAKQHAEADGLR